MSTSPDAAFELFNAEADPSLIFVCDHASSHVPPAYGTLGMDPASFDRHIAYDIGAADVTRSMAREFSAPAVLGAFSRLLIDLNRGADDPTLVMKLSDGAIIPGNVDAGQDEIARRVTRFYRPYHDAIETQISRARGAGTVPCIISIHSFTPEWKGTPRPWHVGVLWSHRDQRLSSALLRELAAEPDLVVGSNLPYSGELDGDCMAQHALAHGLPHVLIEIRQDLIATPADAARWGARLAPLLRRAISSLSGVDGAGSSPVLPQQTEIEAAVFRRLVAHLQARTGTQNIDLMNLAGFCRNCLGNWFAEAAAARGTPISRDAARERVYGMPYAEWKRLYQKEASAEQKAAFEVSHKNHG